MKNYYYCFCCSLLLMLAALFSGGVCAQDLTVSGTVIDFTTEEPLPGVNVILKNTTTGTVTDVNGKYQLSVPDGNTTLVFSSVGFTSEEIPIGNRSVVDLKLIQDIQSLSELVVVGYGVQKKSDLTGAVSSVKAEEITAFPALSAVQTLQGRAAGVQVQSNNGGEPGANYQIKVRGGTSINANSDPLFVVDGFVGGEMPPPEDISSMEILKDASATAIYGSRGANGVILVTTKRGKAGLMKIDFNTSYTIQNVLNRLDLLSGDEFTAYMNDLGNSQTYAGFGANTDWQDLIYRQGFITNNQLSLSGGNENVRYYVSGTYFDQEGVLIGSEYNRFSFNSNLDIKANEFLNVGINLYGRRSTNKGVNTQESTGGSGRAGIVSSAFRFNPDIGIYNSDNSYAISEVGDDIDNPYALGTEYNRERITDYFRANTFAEIELTDWLKFRTTIGIDFNNWRDGTFIPTTLIGGAGVGGRAELDARKITSFLNENYATLSKNFGKHEATLVAGYSFQKERNENWLTGATEFVTNSTAFWNLQGGAGAGAIESGFNERILRSYYGRANYSYDGKYVVTFTGRYDGASNFSNNKKYAFFPSGAISWNMGREAFLEPIDIVSNWKWRLSYGLVGNQAIAPYQSLASLRAIPFSREGTAQNAVIGENIENDVLSWETTAQFNAGTDIGLLKNRLNLTVEYYRMKTTDLLFQRPLPTYIGYDFQYQNIGAVENKGWEFALNSINLDKELQWKTDFNISFNRNEVLELPDNNADIFYSYAPGHLLLGEDNQVIRVGESVGVFYGYVYDGIYQAGDSFLDGAGFDKQAGGERYKDLSGPDGIPDGQLSPNQDRTVIGDPNPDFIWSLNNTFNYKGFDLNIFFQGSQGNDMLSYTLLELNNLSGANNATADALRRWTPTNPNTDVPRALGTRSRRVSTKYVYDASYARLKNISLGYSLPESLTKTLKLTRVRVYVSAQNLLTLTQYPGLDPEVGYRNSSNSSAGNRALGLDYGSYPNVKAFTVGINIGL